MLLFSPAPAGNGGDPTSSLLSTFLMMGAVILIFYFMMIRPQQKRQKAHAKMLSEVKKGDNVVTTSGIHGLVYEVEDNTVTLTVGNNLHIKFDKSAVASIDSK